MDDALIERAASTLRHAAETGTTCDPVRQMLGTETDVDVAYAVQQHNVDLHIANGRRVSGRKIGLTATVVQEQLGVDQPDYGTLFADMCYADGVEIPAGSLIQPKAEAEIAFVFEHDLDKGEHCAVDIINACAYVLPALEIVDSRITDWDIRFVDTVADNASCGLYVVGSRPVRLDRIDVRAVEMSMRVNNDVVSSGVGANCLGNPIQAALWLSDIMYDRGTPIRAGDCIMSGALGAMAPIGEGDSVVADMGELGRVSTNLGRGV